MYMVREGSLEAARPYLRIWKWSKSVVVFLAGCVKKTKSVRLSSDHHCHGIVVKHLQLVILVKHLESFWTHLGFIHSGSCRFPVSKSIAFTKGFSWPVVSDDNGHDYHDAGFCLFQIVSQVNWTARQLCIADMGSNLNWHIFIWNYKKA